ncbi:hypothetical protein GWK90_07175 [Candidatus Hamiltonella defensa]|uniref:Uncharacterized protein n=1 Tax=Candidatus Williamhamiltonella defendens TaxID=138072 RepID=A0AAC9YG84_9ENTR|nr:hypothetical protein [Candidatus Hamiltonella defensa]ASV33990.1 hypothetical protein CJJ18_08395 [Candidatus Hamiltonella defensa]AWK16948.1 hypothetical protein CCS40_08210 [Candidatus Hamiltonella defensa]MBK4362003.1 hypothetical protein [Candidatus Hamiltonella defensa]
MRLFSCLNCLSSNRRTKTPIESQKAKTGIWQQFKKFFVGIKNLKTDRKSVVLSRNVAYSKETGKSRAGVASNTLTVESRSKELVNEIKGARESLNLILNSTHSPYAEAAREYEAKGGEYSRAIQTAKNTESLNRIEKSVKAWIQEINTLLNWHFDSMPPSTNHNHNRTSAPNPSSSVSSNTPESSTGATIVNNSRTISPASEGAQKAVQTIYSDSPPEELKTLVVTNEDLLDNINHLFERGGELPKPYLVEYNCGGISKKRKEEINEIRSEFKELNEIPHSNTTPQQKLKLNELSEKIKNFNEKEKDYNSLIDNSCSESTMALAYQILTGKELRFRGNLDFTKLTLNGEKDFQTDLGLLFDACEGKQNEKYFKSLKFEENRENDLKSELDSFNYPLLLIRTGNGGGHQSGHYKVLLKKNDSWYELNPGADKELQKRQLTSQSELATDVGKDLLRSNFKVIPYTPQCLYAQLILTQDFRTKSQEDIDFIIVTRIDEIKSILSKE